MKKIVALVFCFALLQTFPLKTSNASDIAGETEASEAITDVPVEQFEYTDYVMENSPYLKAQKGHADLFKLLENGQFEEFQTAMESEASMPPPAIDRQDNLKRIVNTWWHYDQNPEKTFERLQQWIRAYPESHIPYTVKGIYHFQNGYKIRGIGYSDTVSEENFQLMYQQFAQANKLLMKAIEINPQTPAAWSILLNIARFYDDHSDPDKKLSSQVVFEKAVQKIPDYDWIYFIHAKSLLPKWGGSLEALQAFTDAFAMTGQPDSMRPVLILETIGHTASELGRQKAAYESYKPKSLSGMLLKTLIEPPTDEAYLNDPQNWELIQTTAENFIAQNPENIYGIYNYATLADKAGKNDLALKYYEMTISKDSGYYIDAHYYAGKIREKQKDYDGAIKHYDTALNFRPNYQKPLLSKAFLLDSTNKLEESLKIYQQLAERHPEYTYTSHTCSLLSRLKRYEEAHRDCDTSIPKTLGLIT
jgi:tetratricopeptide (TPR) repeat protein